MSPAALPVEPGVLVEEFSTLAIDVPAPESDNLDDTPDSAITPKRVSFGQGAVAGGPRTPTPSIRSGRFGPPSLLAKALRSVSDQFHQGSEPEDRYPSSPTTPTDGGWKPVKGRRRPSRGSLKSFGRGA